MSSKQKELNRKKKGKLLQAMLQGERHYNSKNKPSIRTANKLAKAILARRSVEVRDKGVCSDIKDLDQSEGLCGDCFASTV
jgi:hypothetical protein